MVAPQKTTTVQAMLSQVSVSAQEVLAKVHRYEPEVRPGFVDLHA